MPTDVLPVSVVIASLGGRALERTVAGLLAGSSRPAEILVCLPESVQPQAKLMEDDVVRIVVAPVRGQVAQRAAGLMVAREEYVLQLDDDMVVPRDGLQDLWRLSLAAGAGTAVAPVFTDSATGQYLTSYQSDFPGFMRSLAAWLLGGARWGLARMGTIGAAGIPYGVDPRHADGVQLLETEWLPGGAVICRKQDLVMESYFPFPGKAYSEDVIHSLLWKQRGVRLYVAPHLTYGTAIGPGPSSVAELSAERRARVHVIRAMDRSVIRGWLWFWFSLIKLSARKLFRR